MKDPVLTDCPQCGTASLQRLIGAGAGLVFKGSGFYLTDYGKSKSSPASGGKTSDAAPSTAGKSESAGTPANSSPPSTAKD